MTIYQFSKKYGIPQKMVYEAMAYTKPDSVRKKTKEYQEGTIARNVLEVINMERKRLIEKMAYYNKQKTSIEIKQEGLQCTN